jgi:hypothetical protein
MKQKKTVIRSKYFNFLHYYASGIHIFSTELIDGKQKRIDKDMAMKFDEMAQEEYFERIKKKELKKQIQYHLQNVANKLTCNSNKSLFLHNLNIEVKRLSKNMLTVDDLSRSNINKLINFSKNEHNKEFCV